MIGVLLVLGHVLAIEAMVEEVFDHTLKHSVLENHHYDKTYCQHVTKHSRNFFKDYLSEKGIEPVIRRNSSTRSRGSPARAKVVREIRRDGYDSWRERHG